MKVYRHEFMRKYPIVMVEDFSEWADGKITSETNFQKVKFKGRPLTYVVIETKHAPIMEDGRVHPAYIGFTMAMVGGHDKYPVQGNGKLALDWAIRKTMEFEDRGSFAILKAIYESSYGECPHILENVTVDPHRAFQVDKPGDEADEDHWDDLITMMDDEISGSEDFDAIDEGVVTEVTDDGSSAFRGSKSPTPRKSSTSSKTGRPAQAKKNKKPTTTTGQSKTKNKREVADRDPTEGFTHVRGGEGNLYVKGKDLDQDRAQKMASQKGADAKLVNGKMIPLTAAEKQSSMGNQQGTPQTQQAQAPAQAQPEEAPQAGGEVIVVDKDSKQYRDAKAKDKKVAKKPVKDVDADKQASDDQKSLNMEHTTGKNKEVDQGVASKATSSEYYTEESEISDSEFEYKNEENWLDPDHRLTFSDDTTDGKMPMKEMKLLERLANSQKNGVTSKITHFSPNAGAGEISSQAGELCMQMFASMPTEDRQEIRDDMIEFLKENGDRACLSVGWVNAAYNNSMALDNYLNLRYGEGEYEVVASAWDTKEGVEAMVGRDLHSDDSKGYSTDAFFTVKGPDGNIDMIEISLKKDLGVKLLNSGPKEILDRVPSLRGGDLDTREFLKKEQEFVTKSATPANMKKAIKMMVDAEKNIGDYSKSEQKKIKDALKAVQAIDPKMDPAKIIAALKEKPSDKNNLRAAWKPMYTASEVMGDKGFKKIKEESSAMYAKYQSDFFKEFQKNKKVEEATMDIIRQELPLVAVLENEETLLAGEFSVDRATMKRIFGVDDPKEFKESLQVYEPEGEPPFIGYAAGANSKPIPIALIRMRAEALGYGQRVKFDMDIHKQFANSVKEANQEVYGDQDEQS